LKLEDSGRNSWNDACPSANRGLASCLCAGGGGWVALLSSKHTGAKPLLRSNDSLHHVHNARPTIG
jgi:hypothetical protein